MNKIEEIVQTELKEEDELKEEIKIVEEKRKRTKIDFRKVKMPFKTILVYFILYSILGYILETIFGFVTKGTIESRQSFLYGPFCSIYGLGAILFIPLLKPFEHSKIGTFIGGFILGSIIEYAISWIGEAVYQIRWWDYSDQYLNINGRICLAFSVFWGFAGIALMRWINPKIDNILEKIKPRLLTVLVIIGIVFLILDSIITSLALKIFFTRLVHENDLQLKNQSEIVMDYDAMRRNETLKYLSDNVFTDEMMLKTFPNIKLIGKEGKTIWVRDILKDIEPYYFKFSADFKLENW